MYRWLGTGPNITVVDTPGFKDTEDAEFIDELMNVLGDEVIILYSVTSIKIYQKEHCNSVSHCIKKLTVYNFIFLNI